MITVLLSEIRRSQARLTIEGPKHYTFVREEVMTAFDHWPEGADAYDDEWMCACTKTHKRRVRRCHQCETRRPE